MELYFIVSILKKFQCKSTVGCKKWQGTVGYTKLSASVALQYLVQEPRAHDDIQDDVVHEVLPVPITAVAVDLGLRDHEDTENRASDH